MHAQQSGNTDLAIYVGTYTSGESEGIYRLDFNGKALSEKKLVATLAHPEYLTITDDCQHMYAVAQVDSLGGPALVSFQINSEEHLTVLSAVPTQTQNLTHLSHDPERGVLFSVSYSGGEIISFGVENANITERKGGARHEKGSGVLKSRQEKAHPHSIFVGPQKQYCYVPDLGMDAIVRYRIEANGALVKAGETATPPGGGPRHLSFHPSGTFAYVNNEMQSSASAFKVNQTDGSLELIETVSTLPEGYEEKNSTAQILVGATGEYLYVSNRGHNSIAILQLDQQTGKMKLIGHQSTKGETPRNFTISPSGKLLAVGNQNSDTVRLFEIDPTSGMLIDKGYEAEVPTPSCVRILELAGCK